tara:strand:+ start:419 stop:1537 length:1119 start_codon:yes stop_codon:yes gene_type:complete
MALSKIQFGNIGRRNLIINGDMRIAQRGTTHTFQNGTGGYKTVDRWLISEAGTDSFVFEISKSTDAPDDFANSFKVDCTTADASLSADVQISFEQKIEAQNLQHLNYGTSSAKTMTFSFYVKSNKTGTYVCWFYAEDGNRSIGRTYTINSANTWERKVMTIPGDTAGTINNDTGSGFRTRFMLGAGSTYTSGTLQTDWGTITGTQANRYVGQVNLADDTANEWYVTGVQLEVGETATEFEHRTIGEELALCQRYFISTNPNVLGDAATNQNSYIMGTGYNSRARFTYYYPTTMRTKPAGTLVDSSGNGSVAVWHGTTNIAYTGSWTFENTLTSASYYTDTSPSSTINGKAMMSYMGDENTNYNHYLELNAEL